MQIESNLEAKAIGIQMKKIKLQLISFAIYKENNYRKKEKLMRQKKRKRKDNYNYRRKSINKYNNK
jgi:(p)ppGpp synthase/HD superfamily hydrolase